ncbi:MAG TPA: hypothetical protein VKV20_20460 [Ktedonobacteraceae bacterium]|nr:hypothetical protein [Ktedonobacteraceae bacterium]
MITTLPVYWHGSRIFETPPASSLHPLSAPNQIGGPATLRKRLSELEEAGIQEIILRFSDVLNLDMLRFFAKELIN